MNTDIDQTCAGGVDNGCTCVICREAPPPSVTPVPDGAIVVAARTMPPPAPVRPRRAVFAPAPPA